MNKFDCNKCTHQNVCRYKEQIPEFDTQEGSDSIFELVLTCKEYREMVAIPRQSDIPVVVPYGHVVNIPNVHESTSTSGN